MASNLVVQKAGQTAGHWAERMDSMTVGSMAGERAGLMAVNWVG